MREISRRQRRWLGVMVALVVIAVIAEYAYLVTFPPDVLTPRRARAALAEAQQGEPDAPISKENGIVTIGDWYFYPSIKACRAKTGGRHAECGTFYFVEDPPFSTPFGKIASPFGTWKVDVETPL